MRLGIAFSLVLLAACGTTPPPASDAGQGTDAGPPANVCRAVIDCDDGIFCNGPERCAPDDPSAGMTGCVRDPAPCEAARCDEDADRCRSDCDAMPDADGDGEPSMDCGGADCDDTDADRFPGNAEICDLDGHDEDCEPETFGDRDADTDGYIDARCCNGEGTDMVCGDDCNDGNASVHPTQAETCNDVDDNCDGIADEGQLVEGFVDEDRDGHGNAAMPTMACRGTAGVVDLGDDCDDDNVRRHPGQVEICDGEDNDCDPNVDESLTAATWYADLDGDGFGNATSGTRLSCAPLSGYSLRGNDCDDMRAGVSPAANEVCNGRDDDCDGRANFVIAPGNLEDDDLDGNADIACPVGGDCDDYDATTYAGALEVCDGRDNDCDGMSDDGTQATLWFPDLDGDGWGDGTSPPRMVCTPPRGYVLRIGDCDDSLPGRNPGIPDDCDMRDDDCDGSIDENAELVAYYPDEDVDLFGDATDPTYSCRPLSGLTIIGGDCDDTTATQRPGATETCNGEDDDCDLDTDEGFPNEACGLGECRRTVASCEEGVPVVCEPADPTSETCNGLDDDCNGTADDEPTASGDCSDATTFARCIAGQCRIDACATGSGDCNMRASDGCEADLRTSTVNCGRCGFACRGGDTCVGGVCQGTPLELNAGDQHTCVRLGSGSVYCWGANSNGQIGDGTTNLRSRATQASGVMNATALGMGELHSCAVVGAGDLWCWGANGNRQVVFNTTNPVATPTRVGASSDWRFISGGATHTCGIRQSGQITCFGDPSASRLNGACGLSVCGEVNTPISTTASQIDAGEFHTVIRQLTPAVQAAGWGQYNVSGRGDSASNTTLTAMQMEGGGTLVDPVSVCAGEAFSCVVRATGAVLCAGDNSLGQLGNGTMTGNGDLAPVSDITDAVRVDCGSQHACAWLRDGTIKCWGRSLEGQILGASGMMQLTPVPLGTLPGVPIQLALGRLHSCAILDTQRVVCWGDNAQGQLGSDDTLPRTGVVFVSGLP
jgi:alpha-tubulin suppressor-like RCC1 family protein